MSKGVDGVLQGGGDGVLVRLDLARQALAESRDLSEIKEIRDRAEAMRQYARAAHMGLEAQNHAAEIKLRAERKFGELMTEVERSKGGRPAENSVQPGPSFIATLREMEVAPTQAKRWQSVAAVPEEEFEQHVVEVRTSGRELTSAAVVDIGRQYQAERRAVERGTKEQDREEPIDLPCEIAVADAADLPLDSNSVDLVLTSPPYGLDKPYLGITDLRRRWPALPRAQS